MTAIDENTYQYKTVVLHRASLLYDINYESWKIARCRIENMKLQAETSTDEEADLFVERVIDTAINNLKDRLFWCLDTSTASADVSSNLIDMDTENPSEGPQYEPDTSLPVDDFTMDTTIPDIEEHTPETTVARLPQHYTFGFRFSRYWRGNIHSVKSAIHNYIKSLVLSEWFALVKPDEAVRYAQAADKYLTDAVSYARQESMEGIHFRL